MNKQTQIEGDTVMEFFMSEFKRFSNIVKKYMCYSEIGLDHLLEGEEPGKAMLLFFDEAEFGDKFFTSMPEERFNIVLTQAFLDTMSSCLNLIRQMKDADEG